jgi:hypothetical protein
MKPTFLVAGVLAASFSTAYAQPVQPSPSPSSLAALEARVQALEADAEALRQQAAEARAALDAARAEIEQLRQSAATPDAAVPSEPAVAGGGSATAGGNAFNPALSIILTGRYTHHSLDPEAYVRAGFPLVGEGEPAPQGFSLGESEIALSANVDDKFYAQLTLAAESEDGEDEVGIEEAYIETSALPAGLTLRMGRFFSNIGYLNTHHAHTDEFPDRPLAYQALLGNQYGDDGIQLRWVAPTDIFLEVSAEALRGEGFPAGGAARGGIGSYTLAVHAGGDVGTEHSWLAGFSMLDARVRGGEDGYNGAERLYIADLTWKWAPNGNTRDAGVQLRTEYFHEEREGRYVDSVDPAFDQPWNGTRRGVYVEGIYRINRQWEAGYRYDRLWADDAGPYASDFDPHRHGVTLTWLNSEFSLLRLLFGRDYPNPSAADTVLTLQYQAVFGAHGAHKF